MFIRNKIIFAASLLILSSVTYIRADKAELEAIKELSEKVTNIAKEVEIIKRGSTPESIYNLADAVKKGINGKVEHSLKFPVGSTVFGFGACLSLYSLWQGAQKVWDPNNAPKYGHSTPPQWTSGWNQVKASGLGLLACLIGIGCCNYSK